MRKVAIVGPESSGKTTLCETLAEHYAAPWVEEYAREHLTQRNGIYVEEDLRAIAGLQHDIGLMRVSDGWRRHEAVYATMRPHHDPLDEAPGMKIPEMPLVLFDTDMITIMIWSREKFGRVHPQIEEFVRETHYDHWLLCRPDIPWEADPLRENPHDRDRLFKVYERTLKLMEKPYTIIQGDRRERSETAIATIDRLIDSDPVKMREL